MSSEIDDDLTDCEENIVVMAQIHTINSINVLHSSQPLSESTQTLGDAHINDFRPNGAVISNLDYIEYIDSSPTLINTTIQPQAHSTGIFAPASYLPSSTLNHETINKTLKADQSEEAYAVTQEIVIRTSHDPENNVIIEDIDILPEPNPPLDTSTPLGSPSLSTIMQHIETDNLSSFNINTPNSSCAPSSPVRDSIYVPSYDDDTTNSNQDAQPKKKKRKLTKKSNIGKIRKANKSEWIDTKRKVLKNQGLKYISRNGKVRSEKNLLPPCDENCRLKCKEKVSEDVRKQVFDSYWSLGDRLRQWDLLSRWCQRISKRRITTELPSKRIFSIRYFLPITLDSNKDEKVKVCKKMFLNTFAIGDGVVRTALKKMDGGDGIMPARDDRGRHANHPKIKNDNMIKSVCDHVKSLAPVEAHYTRKDSSKLYLHGDLTMSKLFKLYKDWVDIHSDESDLDKARTLRQYTDIVNENLNIEFHRPKKDQCSDCIAYKNLPKPANQNVYEEYQKHIQNKDLARSLKNEDKLSAINSQGTVVTAAFDFQKVHSCPHAETSMLYYKRKLNVFNFTIFEMAHKVGRCYMWHEGIAKRGANEVASCVYDFIKDECSKGVNTVNLYSDNCGGQNRNRIVFMMYLIAAKELKVTITHRFLEKGHTQNENDSIHALIERCAKNKEIYTPDQWFALARWAKENGNPYIVKEITTDDIFDFKQLLIGKNWSKNDKNSKIMWSKIREVHVSSAEPDILYYKVNFDEPYQRLYVRRSLNRKRQDRQNEDLTKAYTGPLPIPSAKLTDLKYICEHNIVPRQYHAFYYSLTSGNVVVSSSDEE